MRFQILSLAIAVGIAQIAAPHATAGDVIDRIVARVNGSTILLTDWDQELCFEALVDGRPPDTSTVQQRREALDRLIDLELLRQQLKVIDASPVDTETVKKKIDEIRTLHRVADSDRAWTSELAKYGLTEDELSARIRQQLSLMQSVDVRLRPSIQIDSSSVEEYYRGKFSEDLKKTGASPVALSDVSGKIRELLTEERLNNLLVSWLQTLRSGSEIRTFIPPDASSGGQAQ